MRIAIASLMFCALVLPEGALAQQATAKPDAAAVTPSASETAAPSTAAPTTEPPPPPTTLPSPPSAQASQSSAPDRAGQWVYTTKDGWVWMPYGDEYVYTPGETTGEPYVYVYTPAFGWRWVAAPWVWGIGPLPYFGPLGPWRFHWYRGPAYHFRAVERPLFNGRYGFHFDGHGHR